jgi:SAM-dependent methyltransferase
VYSWLLGGFDEATARGQRELAAVGLLGRESAGYAVDLGAGFGMHAIPLARQGWKVLAIDSSPLLLEELRAHGGRGQVATVQDDLLRFPQYLSRGPDAILCMGDTLTHLPDIAAVRSLFSLVSRHLPPGGRFVLSFRDYSRTLDGPDRFILVKGDDSRVFTCFLEYGEDSVRVHDILHERSEGGWRMRVSAYEKLRLRPEWMQRELESQGLHVRVVEGRSGLLWIVAVPCWPGTHTAPGQGPCRS